MMVLLRLGCFERREGENTATQQFAREKRMHGALDRRGCFREGQTTWGARRTWVLQGRTDNMRTRQIWLLETP